MVTHMATNSWPSLPLGEWQDTYATLHMWTQIVGKIRLALTPVVILTAITDLEDDQFVTAHLDEWLRP